MKLIFGSYEHAENQVDLAIDRRVEYNSRQEKYKEVETWTVSGFLKASGSTAQQRQDSIYSQQQNLINAYNSGDLNSIQARFVRDDGDPAHTLDGSASSSGIQIVQKPSFPGGKGAEFATKRFYTIVFRAEFPATPGTQIVQFQETVAARGGGPLIIPIDLLEGPPVYQQVKQATHVLVTQSGSVVAHGGYVAPALPLIPDRELPHLRQVSRDSPQYDNGQYINYRVSWSYTFAMDFQPAIPPNLDYPGA